MLQSETITTEIEMKAMEYINAGYQKILTFECESGGFNWWEGDNPGNPILTALAIMMLTDTKNIYDTIDESVILRSAEYLASVQKSDGAWSEESHLHAGNENLGASSLRSTCYIAWGMAYGGFADMPAVGKSVSYIKANLPSETDDYTKAMCANALIDAGQADSLVNDILSDFHDSAVDEDGVIHWSASGNTLVNSGGNAADVELTSLVAIAMAGKGSYPQDVNGVVEWLVQSKDPQGNWGYNTQATVLALKTFLKALALSPGETEADVVVRFSGEVLAEKHFDNFNKDVLWQVEVTSGLGVGEHLVKLDYTGVGALSYQIVSTHYVPWDDAELPEGPLSINVSYDATTLTVDDIVTATVTITNNDPAAQGMVLVTVGIPPGFALVADDLVHLKSLGLISSFEIMGKQLVLYLDSLPAGEPTVLEYSLVAEYPVKAQTGGAEAKYYYNSEVNAEEASQDIEVLP